ncbi:Aldo-keto reductase yakc [NADP+] [Fusarium odoratissimum]|uniref:Aldo-keto reductase yakc [NADP+] n=1 Tax=Fusarium oxysporum f. sp. cubense (strain race 4) TaxID=2502994 RepID=N1S903_FUSC4|nr:Aldo-keto reductase yakc [NADP+] [Fusarium odoratissimum]
MSAKTAPRVSLGKNGPLVSRMGLGLGLGTMGLTRPTYGAISSVTFWDSADYYNDCEEIIGKWFRRTGKRGDIFLATKFGYVKNSQAFELNTSYVYVKKACAESLRLLDIESIDLSYLHTPNPETPIEETMRALKELQESDTLSAFGLYCEGEKGTHILDTCRELDLAIVAAMPLGRGLLTANFIEGTASGKQDSDVRYQLIPRFMGENREKNIQLVSQFKGLADKKGITTAQLAIAWLLKQGDDIIPIPGTKRIQYFEENWAALDIVLGGEEEPDIRRFVDKADIAGVPLPSALDGWLFRDTKEESV